MFKLSIAVGIIVGFFIVLYGAKFAVRKMVKRNSIKESEGKLVLKIMRSFLGLLALLIIVSIWGIDVKNIWVFLTSVIGIVAIGFFAVWSILSNVVAGFLLFISNPFNIEDTITILPDDIKGKVVDLKLMFVVLQDDEGAIMHIPNNLLFQKVVKKI